MEYSSDKKIKPYTRVRSACPFYGFSLNVSPYAFVMEDSGGNQCALKTGSYSPCQMEVRGDKPNWSKCYYNTKENLVVIEKLGLRVFPKEFRPSKTELLDGLPLSDWMLYTTEKVH